MLKNNVAQNSNKLYKIAMLYAFIPARYASTRFPGKPLVLINGKTMLEWVYSGVKNSKQVDKIIILTDDLRIKLAAEKFLNTRDDVLITPKELSSGTERIAYFLKHNKEEAKKIAFILNIQGDEPLIEFDTIDTLAKFTKTCDSVAPVATLYRVCENKDLFYDSNVVKVVKDNHDTAIYFSRAPIPSSKTKLLSVKFFQHLGLYGYKKDFLLKYTTLTKGPLEEIESLEQLRFLENGIKIKLTEVSTELFGVDTKEDLYRVESIIKSRKYLA